MTENCLIPCKSLNINLLFSCISFGHSIKQRKSNKNSYFWWITYQIYTWNIKISCIKCNFDRNSMKTSQTLILQCIFWWNCCRLKLAQNVSVSFSGGFISTKVIITFSILKKKKKKYEEKRNTSPKESCNTCSFKKKKIIFQIPLK